MHRPVGQAGVSRDHALLMTARKLVDMLASPSSQDGSEIIKTPIKRGTALFGTSPQSECKTRDAPAAPVRRVDFDIASPVMGKMPVSTVEDITLRPPRVRWTTQLFESGAHMVRTTVSGTSNCIWQEKVVIAKLILLLIFATLAWDTFIIVRAEWSKSVDSVSSGLLGGIAESASKALSQRFMARLGFGTQPMRLDTDFGFNVAPGQIYDDGTMKANLQVADAGSRMVMSLLRNDPRVSIGCTMISLLGMVVAAIARQ